MSELPQGWVETTSNEVCEYITSGSRDWKKYYSDEGAIFIRTQDINKDVLNFSNVAYVKLPEKVEGKRSRVEPGDLLVTITGANVGKIAVVSDPVPEAYVSQSVGLMRLKDKRIAKFLHYYLQSEEVGRKHLLNMVYGMGRPVLSLQNLRDIRITLPPLSEQRRIVARIEELFSRIDAGVAALRHAKAQLQRYRQSVLAAAVTGQLTQAWREQHPDTEPASALLERILEQRREQCNGRGKYSEPASPKQLTFDLPSNSWARVSIDQLAVDTTIGLVRAAVLQNSSEKGFAYLKMDKIDMNGRVNLDGLVYVDATKDEVARFSLRKGDVLFNTRNSVELVGKTGHVASEPITPLVFNNNLMRLRFVGSALPAFVALQMCSKQFRDRMEGAKRATTSIAAVYGKDLRPLPIALPPLAEQHQIVAEVEARITAIDHLETELDRQITRSNRLRQSTLSRAFAGEF